MSESFVMVVNEHHIDIMAERPVLKIVANCESWTYMYQNDTSGQLHFDLIKNYDVSDLLSIFGDKSSTILVYGGDLVWTLYNAILSGINQMYPYKTAGVLVYRNLEIKNG